FSFENSKKLNTLYNSIPWFIISVVFLFYDYQSKFGMVIYAHITLSLFWLPSLFLFLSYWLINKNAIVKIDSFENIISYQKDNKKIMFNRNEIDKCILNEEESTSNRSNTKKFSYLHITLFNKEEIIITNFITEPRTIINLLNLNYKVNDRLMSILPLPF
ncbi:MAG TPA: hypothetical protein VJ780_12160, partial [Flavobacterium sp.]|nr:hypothetical protein [Flavobacterium sp.]